LSGWEDKRSYPLKLENEKKKSATGEQFLIEKEEEGDRRSNKKFQCVLPVFWSVNILPHPTDTCHGVHQSVLIGKLL
jgi:hypothetical protein